MSPLEPRSAPPRGPARFLPPLLWMGLIAVGSSSLLANDRTGPWMLAVLGHLAPGASPAVLHATHVGLRKMGHLLEYGILAILWYRALAPSPTAIPLAFVLATLYAGIDELRQGLAPGRVPALTDVAVDGLGALLGLGAWTDSGPLRTVTLRVATWGVGCLAAVAGVGFVLDSALGRPATDIGVAAVGLGLLTVGLAWRGRTHVPAGSRASPPR